MADTVDILLGLCVVAVIVLGYLAYKHGWFTGLWDSSSATTAAAAKSGFSTSDGKPYMAPTIPEIRRCADIAFHEGGNMMHQAMNGLQMGVNQQIDAYARMKQQQLQQQQYMAHMRQKYQRGD